MNPIKISINDLKSSFNSRRVFLLLGWQDVKQRYKRSKIGPFWLTISMGVMIGTIGLVFGNIFNTKMDEFLPFLTIGLILWAFTTSCIIEGCNAFIESSPLIKQLPIALPTHIFRVIWRNLIILSHNIIILPIVYIIFSIEINATSITSIAGLVIILLNVTWISIILGIISTRFRDVPQLVQSGLQVLFYITPVIWMPQLLLGRASEILLTFNPFYHMIELVRSPLLGSLPSTENWVISIGMSLLGWSLALLIYGLNRNKITYWV